MIVNRRGFACILYAAICLIFLLGCNSRPEMKDPKAALEGLAVEYWTNRLVKKDYKSTYKMELEKDSIPFSEYLKKVQSAGQIEALSFKTKEIKIEGDKAIVMLDVKCRAAFVSKAFEMPLPDVWILKSDQWRHRFSSK